MNLLKETIAKIKEFGLNQSDIVYIGLADGSKQFSWSEFSTFADHNYDSGFGCAEVNEGLIIGFAWGETMVRAEYDGSEWWEIHRPFVMPELKALNQDTKLFYYKDK